MAQRDFLPRKHNRFAIFVCRAVNLYEYVSCHCSFKEAGKAALILTQKTDKPIHIAEMQGIYERKGREE